jgi:altronate dehydratase large subunit
MTIAAKVPGAVSFYHQHGCAQLEFDRVQTLCTLAGTGANPNVAAVLVVGLGCENVTADEVAHLVAGSGKPVEALTIQDEGGTERAAVRGIALCGHLLAQVGSPARVPMPVPKLVLATECGGSDALSGLTANPAVGWVADQVVAGGGTVILSETTELIGAEHLLAARSAPGCSAGEALVRAVAAAEGAIKATGVDLRGTQPAPGNIRGGLSSIEEKSLGCIHKGGTSALRQVIPYAKRPSERGLVFMDTPGHDVESVSGMVAGGAQVVLFTTGRGTPTGSPVAPVIKIATNDRVWASMRPNLDFNAGGIAAGRESVAEAGRRLLSLTLAVLSGQLTRSEVLGHREFGIYRIGPTT